MRSFKTILLAVPVLAVFGCSDQVKVKGTVTDGPGRSVVAKRLDVSTSVVIDTLKTDKSGRFSFRVPVKKGQPEFVYLFDGDRKIASLLLEKGQKVTVTTDTLGHYQTSGSEGSALMRTIDANYSAFAAAVISAASSPDASREVAKVYVDHYRQCIKYVMEHPRSLTVIPVLYERLNDQTPIFSQATDALHFRSACDSLKLVYPDSKYVRALEKETRRREGILDLNKRIENGVASNYPDLSFPGIDGEKVALSGVDAKVILLHFWNSDDAAQKMFNLDVLKPIWDQYHSRGLQIYSVSLSTDKVAWASVMKAQNLPWINVIDIHGAASRAITLYNLKRIPETIIIADQAVKSTGISGEAGLRKELNRILK